MNCILYYGSDRPDFTKTRSLTETLVVLQDYHPLCLGGLFANEFPHCQRFVYWNPAKITNREIERRRLRLPLIERTAGSSELALIDLRSLAGRRFVIGEALSRLRQNDLHGLFVDDLDTWCESPRDRECVLQLFTELNAELSRPTRWFINRAFSLWRHLEGVAAVLLESLALENVLAAEEDEFFWTRNIIDFYLQWLHATHPQVPIFSLTYDPRLQTDDPAAWAGLIPANDPWHAARLEAARRLAALITTRLTLAPRLDQWPESCL